MAAYLDIEVQRNADYHATWRFRDKITGEPLNVSSWLFSLQVRPVAGASGPPIAYGSVDITDALEGKVGVKIRGSDFAAVEGEMEIVRLAYDFIAKDRTDTKVVDVRGQIILIPGVSSV